MFANIASMGDRTHFHFAVFRGEFESNAWRGALPPTACSGSPAFPYRFVDPNAFLAAHLQRRGGGGGGGGGGGQGGPGPGGGGVGGVWGGGGGRTGGGGGG